MKPDRQLRVLLSACALFASTMLCAQTLRSPAEAQIEPSDAPVRVVVGTKPISIGLPIDQERIITFPTDVRLGVPAEIAALLRVQVVGKNAYLLSRGAFARTRIVAQSLTNSSFILLDVSAAKSFTASAPVEIQAKAPTTPPASATSTEAAAPEVDSVTLTRFAVQQVYAPQRLIKVVDGVRKVGVDAIPVLGLYRGAAITAEPLGSWRFDQLYVTAVRLTNHSKHGIHLDARQLRGRWISATFFERDRLSGAGEDADYTVVFLVSAARFEQSL